MEDTTTYIPTDRGIIRGGGRVALDTGAGAIHGVADGAKKGSKAAFSVLGYGISGAFLVTGLVVALIAAPWVALIYAGIPAFLYAASASLLIGAAAGIGGFGATIGAGLGVIIGAAKGLVNGVNTVNVEQDLHNKQQIKKQYVANESEFTSPPMEENAIENAIQDNYTTHPDILPSNNVNKCEHCGQGISSPEQILAMQGGRV